MTDFPNRAAAVEALVADGYRPSAIPGSPYWVSRGTTHGWEPYDRVHLAEVREYHVDAAYGGGSYWSIRYD